MSKSTKKLERHFGLSPEEFTDLKAKFEQSKGLPNPHRDGASATAPAEALCALHNAVHEFFVRPLPPAIIRRSHQEHFT